MLKKVDFENTFNSKTDPSRTAIMSRSEQGTKRFRGAKHDSSKMNLQLQYRQLDDIGGLRRKEHKNKAPKGKDVTIAPAAPSALGSMVPSTTNASAAPSSVAPSSVAPVTAPTKSPQVEGTVTPVEDSTSPTSSPVLVVPTDGPIISPSVSTPSPVTMPLPTPSPMTMPLPTPSPVSNPLPSPVSTPLPTPSPVTTPLPTPSPVITLSPTPQPSTLAPNDFSIALDGGNTVNAIEGLGTINSSDNVSSGGVAGIALIGVGVLLLIALLLRGRRKDPEEALSAFDPEDGSALSSLEGDPASSKEKSVLKDQVTPLNYDQNPREIQPDYDYFGEELPFDCSPIHLVDTAKMKETILASASPNGREIGPNYLVNIVTSMAYNGYKRVASSSLISSPKEGAKVVTEFEELIHASHWAKIAITAGRLANLSLDDIEAASIDESTMTMVSMWDAGDWVKMGTAVASRFASNVSTASSIASRTRDLGTDLAIDHARSAELVDLVEAGNWEAVMLTASRYDAEVTLSPMLASMDSSGTNSSQEVTTRSQVDVKAEIESLIREIIPEESDLVDALMMQCFGHEEALLETLRTMKQRYVSESSS